MNSSNTRSLFKEFLMETKDKFLMESKDEFWMGSKDFGMLFSLR